MMIRFSISKHPGRLAWLGLSFLATTLLAVPAVMAQDRDCLVTRDEVEKAILEGATDTELFEKYAGCKDPEAPAGAVELQPLDTLTKLSSFGHKQKLTQTGSPYWEGITSCGYHPQRKELTCPIEIRRRTGYGGLPALQPAGSFEYVQFCVDTGAGLQPVNVSGVHLHDEAHGAFPNWYLTAVVAADGDRAPQLFSRPLRGQTLRARAILSWAINPFGNCNFIPIWGNQADFRVRLDP